MLGKVHGEGTVALAPRPCHQVSELSSMRSVLGKAACDLGNSQGTASCSGEGPCPCKELTVFPQIPALKPQSR